MSDKDDINWTNVIIAVVLLLLSSSTVSMFKHIRKIPMGPAIGCGGSTTSFIVASLILMQTFDIDINLF